MSNLLRELGFLTWKGVFAKAVFGKDVAGTLAGLSSNGPVVLFDRELALVVSPLDNFKTAVHTYSAGAWETGVTSELTSLPVGFVHRTLITAEVGITQAIGSYGQIVQKLYGLQRGLLQSDPVVNYLSYWTDNGAYYYGDQWHEAGGGGQTCNEASMIEVARGLERENLLDAVRIWQLDDWWYPGHKAVFVHCVQNWTLVPPAFNRSLAELSRTVGKPLLLYVPFFCPENVYTQQFKFLQGSHGITQFAVPEPNNALAFYRMLFDYGMKNGMTGFEHDFLNFNFLAVPNFRKAFDASRRWLQAMHQAALERVVPIQFCMALPSDLMASLELQAVTNYRASDDYATTDNYDIGASSLLGFALQLRPSKDSLWTRRPADAAASGRPWGPHQNPGANCELNVIIATLSTGPVILADKAGETNTTLVWRSARADGWILQPDKPATSIDATFTSILSRDANLTFHGHVWSTYALVEAKQNDELMWHYLLSIDVNTSWQLTESDFFPRLNSRVGWVGRRWHQSHWPTPCVHGQPAVSSGCLLGPTISSQEDLPKLLNDRPIMVANDTHKFDLLQLSPVLENGWVLLGEVGKYVSVSRKRFIQVSTMRGGMRVELQGVPKEETRIVALQPRTSDKTEWTIIERLVRFEHSTTVIDFTAHAGTLPEKSEKASPTVAGEWVSLV